MVKMNVSPIVHDKGVRAYTVDGENWVEKQPKNYGYTPLTVNGKAVSVGLIRLSGVVRGIFLSTRKGHWWFAPKWWTL